jgi:ubiquinone/menaquinone biosynthesis C-methylase UbiE
MNLKFLSGDNEKYMKMYNWMSSGYDFVETIVGKIKYGNQVNQMRQDIMSKLEWKNDLTVLYVSIGTGKDLEYIPKNINVNSLNVVGADISLGMLKKCRSKFNNKLNLFLTNCCAEDLPFKDNSFDIVFHVGGINFFNNKSKAIEEMIRVAKSGTKLLIADETNDLLEKQYKKNNFSKNYFKNATIDLAEIENLIPRKERKTEILWEGRFYCMTFRK